MLLINDIKTLKDTLGGVQRNMDWTTWGTFVEQVEFEMILPIIGQKFYEELTAVSLTATQTLLVKRLQKAIAYYAYVKALPQMSVATGDAGIMPNTPPNTALMPKWMFINLLKTNLSNADKSLEDALTWLEGNKDKDEFKTWKASDEYTISHDLLINSATELTFFFPAARYSRRLYLSLRPFLIRSEMDYIRPLIGAAFFDELKKENDAEASPEEIEVRRMLNYCLAHHAFAESIPFLNLNEDFRLVSDVEGLLKEDLPGENKRTEMKLQCEEKYKSYAIKLRNYLNAHASADLFANYFTSDLYISDHQNKGTVWKRRPIDPTKSFVKL